MDLDHSLDGTVKISMIKYVKNILDGFLEASMSTYKTPTPEHLFQVRDEKDGKVIPKEQAHAFHCSVAQLLFLRMQAHPDIQTTVAVLTTRVKKSNEDGWGSLKRF